MEITKNNFQSKLSFMEDMYLSEKSDKYLKKLEDNDKVNFKRLSKDTIKSLSIYYKNELLKTPTNLLVLEKCIEYSIK